MGGIISVFDTLNLGNERPKRIQQFIDKDLNMGKFVILDDDCYELRQQFAQQLVCCPNRFGIQEYQQAVTIFKRKNTPSVF